MMAVLLAAAALLLGCAVLGSLAWDTWRFGIGMLPTSRAVRRLCLQQMQQADGPRQAVDLGAGMGGMARAMARQLPQTQVLAVEVSPVPWLLGQALSRLGPGLPNLRWRRGDLMQQDLRAVDLVFCYLSHRQMPALAAKLAAELAPGCQVISHTFALPGWRPQRTLWADDAWRSPVYVYCAGAAGQKVSGPTS